MMMKQRTQSGLVRVWCARLDRELRKLDAERAQDLRAELVAHLEASIGSDDSDEHVREVLDTLGDPGQLVTEALDGATPKPLWRRVRRRTWAVATLGVVVVAFGAVTGLRALIPADRPAPLEGNGGVYPLYRQDGPSVDTEAGDDYQETVLARPGQRQGLAVDVANVSGVKQTVLGIADDFAFFNGKASDVDYAISRQNAYTPDVAYPGPLTTGSVTIGKQDIRSIRLSIVTGCGAPGSVSAFNELPLRMRYDGETYVQVVHLRSYYAVRYPADTTC